MGRRINSGGGGGGMCALSSSTPAIVCCDTVYHRQEEHSGRRDALDVVSLVNDFQRVPPFRRFSSDRPTTPWKREITHANQYAPRSAVSPSALRRLPDYTGNVVSQPCSMRCFTGGGVFRRPHTCIVAPNGRW